LEEKIKSPFTTSIRTKKRNNLHTLWRGTSNWADIRHGQEVFVIGEGTIGPIAEGLEGGGQRALNKRPAPTVVSFGRGQPMKVSGKVGKKENQSQGVVQPTEKNSQLKKKGTWDDCIDHHCSRRRKYAKKLVGQTGETPEHGKWTRYPPWGGKLAGKAKGVVSGAQDDTGQTGTGKKKKKKKKGRTALWEATEG